MFHFNPTTVYFIFSCFFTHLSMEWFLTLSHPTRRCKEMWPFLWWLHWRTSVLCFHVAVQFHSGLPSRCSRYPTGQVCWALQPMKSDLASVPLHVIFTKSDFYSQFNISSSSFSCYSLSQSSSNPISFLKISPCTSTHADISRLWTCIYSRENINSWPKKGGAPFFWLVLFYWSIVDLQYCVSFKCTVNWFGYSCTHTHTHIYIYIYIIFSILFHYSLLQDIENSSPWRCIFNIDCLIWWH